MVFGVNDGASAAVSDGGARAATDITGFGLAGHTIELADASDVTIRIELDRLPVFEGVIALAEPANLSRASGTNREYCRAKMLIPPTADARLIEIVLDPQTSGGLLIAIERNRADELVEACRGRGVEHAPIVGAGEPAGDSPPVLQVRGFLPPLRAGGVPGWAGGPGLGVGVKRKSPNGDSHVGGVVRV